MKRTLVTNLFFGAIVLMLIGAWQIDEARHQLLNAAYLAVLVFPLLDASLTPTKPLAGTLGDRQRDRIRFLSLRLWAYTVVAFIALSAYAYFAGEYIFGYAVLAQLYLIYTLARPLITAKTDFKPTRQAILSPRDLVAFVPSWAWKAAWAGWSGAVAVVLVALLFGRGWLHLEDKLVPLAIAGGAIAVAPFISRWWLRRPIETGLEHTSSEECRSILEAKAWGTFAIASSIGVSFSLFAILNAARLYPAAVLPLMIFGPGIVLTGVMVIVTRRQHQLQRGHGAQIGQGGNS